jgi:hypothetical protein
MTVTQYADQSTSVSHSHAVACHTNSVFWRFIDKSDKKNKHQITCCISGTLTVSVWAPESKFAFRASCVGVPVVDWRRRRILSLKRGVLFYCLFLLLLLIVKRQKMDKVLEPNNPKLAVRWEWHCPSCSLHEAALVPSCVGGLIVASVSAAS